MENIEFKIGQRVKYIEDTYSAKTLTLGKIYTVEEPNSDDIRLTAPILKALIWIINDKGRKSFYFKRRFKKVGSINCPSIVIKYYYIDG